MVLHRCLPDPAGPLWVHRRCEGWFDGVAFESPQVLVTADDPESGHPDATVVDGTGLLAAHGDALAARLTPVLDAIRALAPFGRRGLWGTAADEVAGAALWAARAGASDLDAAWRTAVAVTDALAARAPWIRTRPRPFSVDVDQGRSLFPVKGTCCLYYKTQPQPPDPRDGYCTTCPLRDDTSRRQRLVEHLRTGGS